MSVVSGEVAEFEAQRPRLFAVAYRLLGTASEAEDAVQDTFLRWNHADHAAIVTPAAWLTKVLTNLCLNRLTSARVQRESYVGSWLPEPVRTDDSALGPLETAEQRDSVSLAVLLLLERLTPAERAVFVLREAFDYPHREIAEILELTEANSQQLYRRARQRLGEDRTRFEASPAQSHRIAERFLDAARGGDLTALERMLADDIVAWSDGGGSVTAARRPVYGVAKVARLFHGMMNQAAPELEIMFAEVNGQPGILAVINGQLIGVIVLSVSSGRISAVHTVVNPDKLTFVAAQQGLSVGDSQSWSAARR